MNITRRQFVTAMGAAGAAMVLPRPLLAQAITPASAKVLQGFGPLQPRATKPCSLMGCMEQVLYFLGDDYDFVELMGLSGAAFRIRLAFPTTTALMGGRVHPGVSTDASIGPYLNQLANTAGRSFEIDGFFMHDQGKGPIIDRIRRTIDSGLPIIALNMCNDSRWGIIVGYDPDRLRQDKLASDGLLARTYNDKDPNQPSRPQHFPWNLLIPARARRTAMAQDQVRAALANAVADFATPTRTITGPTGWFWNWKPEYRNGSAAYDAWIEDLADDAVDDLPPAQHTNYWQGTAVMFDVLHNARSAAAAFLDRHADRFAGSSRDAIIQAAQGFRSLAQYMEEHWGSFPYKRSGYIESNTGWLITTEQENSNGRALPALADVWSPAMRSDAVDVLRVVKNLDDTAFAHLKRAIA